MKIKGKLYYVAVIIWAIVEGHWPKSIIDHEDRNPGNNRRSNLRLSSPRLNRYNCGAKGYSIKRGRYYARIIINGSYTHLGVFDDAEQAHLAYLEALGNIPDDTTSQRSANGKET